MLVLSKRIDATPTLPQSVLRLGALRNDPDRSLAAVAAIVETDPVLSAKILGLANSSYYSAKGSITSISHACTLLGETEIYSMSLLLSLHNHFRFDLEAYNMNEQRFLHNTLMQTKLMNKWLKYLQTHHADALRLAAFLSDIGKILINQMLKEEGKTELFKAKLQRGISEHIVEMEVVGATTLEVSSMMLRHWQVPEAIVSLLYYTAKPQNTPDTLKAAVNMFESVHNIWQHWKASDDRIFQEALMGFAVFNPKLLPPYEKALKEVLQQRSA